MTTVTTDATTVTIELPDNGQSFELPAEIAGDDDFIRKFLAPHYPDIANAEIKREDKDGRTVIKIIKRAGPKSNACALVIAALDAAPQHTNPAVAMCLALGGATDTPDIETLVARQSEIETAIRAGEEEALQVRASLKALNRAVAAPAQVVPVGL